LTTPVITERRDFASAAGHGEDGAGHHFRGSALGRTIRWMVCHFEAPQAKAASRTPRGTAASASSVATMTTGKVIRANVSACQRMPPVPNVGVGRFALKKPWK